METETINAVNVSDELRPILVEMSKPEVIKDFGFINKNILMPDYTNVMAITNINNINKGFLESSKQILISDMVIDAEQYKERNDINKCGYSKEFVDAAIKVFKSFFKIKKDDKIYVYYTAYMPIVITLSNDIQSADMAIVIAPRVIND